MKNNTCIDLLASDAFSIQVQRERTNWLIKHILHNWQDNSPLNSMRGLSCYRTDTQLSCEHQCSGANES